MLLATGYPGCEDGLTEGAPDGRLVGGHLDPVERAPVGALVVHRDVQVRRVRQLGGSC